jgi:AraC-like DNA-binding protein
MEADPKQILRRAGLAAELLQQGDFQLSIDAYFRLWTALREIADRPDFELTFAMEYAHGPFASPIFAFSCAETLFLGLERLAIFKPLMGPMRMTVTRDAQGCTLDKVSVDPNHPVPATLSLTEALYIVECARTFTATKLTPLSVEIPTPLDTSDEVQALLGGAPKATGRSRVTFRAEDTDRPLITRSATLWETVEPMLAQQLADRTLGRSMQDRVRSALQDALPGGAASLDDIARRLNMSRRSLQRRLGEEGNSFQDILADMRAELAQRYLRDSTLSVPEISYLLGFRDTSSFFRAFQGWMGTTPAAFREAGEAAKRPA